MNKFEFIEYLDKNAELDEDFVCKFIDHKMHGIKMFYLGDNAIFVTDNNRIFKCLSSFWDYVELTPFFESNMYHYDRRIMYRRFCCR